MGALAQVRSNGVIDATLATTALTASTAPIHVRLMTAVGTTTTNGTELATSGGYTSGVGAPTVTFAAASAGSAASNAAVTVTNMPAATVTAVELWDSAATPIRQWWGLLTAAKTTNAGDTLTIPSASLTVAFP